MLYRCAQHLDFVKARGTGATESRWHAAKAIQGKVRGSGIWQVARVNAKLLKRGKMDTVRNLENGNHRA